MSTAIGGKGRTGQKYQNTFSYKHNTNSKKTAKIAGIVHSGICDRCTDKIEWKKKFRKYKPLIGRSTKCRQCNMLAITLAYHILCNACAKSKGTCPMCNEAKPIKVVDEELECATFATSKDISAYISLLRERERRKLQRLQDAKMVKFYKKSDSSIVVRYMKKESEINVSEANKTANEEECDMRDSICSYEHVSSDDEDRHKNEFSDSD